MASDGSPTVSIPEDIAHIIVKHLAEHYKWQSNGFVPSKHWTNVKGVSKAFYKAVHQVISEIVLVAVFKDYDDYGVCFAYKNALPDGAVFREKRRLTSYLKFIALHVNRPVCLDVKGYYRHQPDEEVFHALCSFREVNGVVFRRPCSCPACSRLILRAMPVPPMFIEPERDSEDSEDDSDE
ncbi:hypothetical protein Aduo_006969 [Ancylostoma duodenale]